MTIFFCLAATIASSPSTNVPPTRVLTEPPVRITSTRTRVRVLQGTAEHTATVTTRTALIGMELIMLPAKLIT